MAEIVLIVALFVVAYRLRRASRAPPRVPVEVHIYHHFPDGPGERLTEASDERDMAPPSTNVVSFRRR